MKTLGLLTLAAFLLLGMEGWDQLSGGELYLASIQSLVQQDVQNLPPTGSQPQSIQPPGVPGEEVEESGPGDFVDPREIKQVLREIRQLRSDIKRVSNQLKKVAGGDADLPKLSEIASQLDKTQAVLSNASASHSDLREAIQDFHDNQIWDQLSKFRAKAELPQQIKQISSSLKRLEKIVQTKAVGKLGLNLEKVRASIDEMKQNLQAVQSNFASGNLEEAMEAMQYFHEGGWPGEIDGTIFRVRDIKSMLNRVRDEQIKAQVERILQEVIDAFNEGNYRDARETLDEYADDLQRLINQFLRSSFTRGSNRLESFNKIRQLEDLVKVKLQEIEGRRERSQAGGSENLPVPQSGPQPGQPQPANPQSQQ